MVGMRRAALVAAGLLLVTAVPSPASAHLAPQRGSSPLGVAGATHMAGKKLPRPKSTLTYTAELDPQGRLNLAMFTNATRVRLQYRAGPSKSKQVKLRSRTLKVAGGVARLRLRVGASDVRAKGLAGKYVRTGDWVPLMVTAGGPGRAPVVAFIQVTGRNEHTCGLDPEGRAWCGATTILGNCTGVAPARLSTVSRSLLRELVVCTHAGSIGLVAHGAGG